MYGPYEYAPIRLSLPLPWEHAADTVHVMFCMTLPVQPSDPYSVYMTVLPDITIEVLVRSSGELNKQPLLEL